ncbi:MAG: hypothetical protein Q8Q49_03180 [bacterium]|nr:hypothetical protein [bacterium]
MKIQDIVFVVILIILLIIRRPKYATIAGIFSLAVSIPFFASWVFFTAERLVWYAAAFFLLSVALLLMRGKGDE